MNSCVSLIGAARHQDGTGDCVKKQVGISHLCGRWSMRTALKRTFLLLLLLDLDWVFDLARLLGELSLGF